MKMNGTLLLLPVCVFVLCLFCETVYSQEEATKRQPPLFHDATPCEKVHLEQIKVPEDFAISRSEGPTHADWGAHRFVLVRANGKYSVRETRWARDQKPESGDARKNKTLPAVI